MGFWKRFFGITQPVPVSAKHDGRMRFTLSLSQDAGKRLIEMAGGDTKEALSNTIREALSDLDIKKQYAAAERNNISPFKYPFH